MASRERVVEFAVKARDEFSKVLGNLERQQKRALTAAEKTSARRSFVADAGKEVAAARGEYERLISTIGRYNASLADGRQSGKLSAAEQRELAEAINLTRARANEAAVAYGAAKANLVGLTNSGKSGFAAFDRMASSMQRVATAAVQENVALSATPANLNKVATASKTAAAGQKQLETAATRASAALNRQRAGASGAKGERQSVEMWGLKPWQMTNLGYQINDVISGLAMGQRPMQVLAQQAGQFVQIWPNAMVALTRSIPIIAAVTAALTPFVAVGLRLKEVGELSRQFSADLALSADGARYNAEELTKAAVAMREFDISTKDARDTTRQFAKSGVPVAEMQRLAEMAKRIADLQGTSVPEAAGKLLSVEGIRELDRELNFLTASQYESLTAMERSGDVVGALAQGQGVLAQQLAASKQATSDWQQALKDLKSSWNALLSVIEGSGIVQKVMELEALRLRILAAAASAPGKALDWATAPTDPATIEAQIRAQEELIRVERERIAALGDLDGLGQLNIDRAEAELSLLQDQLRARKDEATLTDQSAAQGRAKLQATEAIAKLVHDATEPLREEVDLAGKTNRELFIEKNTREAINKIIKEGHALTQQTIDGIRKQVGAIYDAGKAAEWSAGKNVAGLADKIIGAEYGDGSKYKNDNSSAAGAGQFIASTWLAMFKKYFPDKAEGLVQTMGETAAKQYILDLRKDQQLSKTMVEFYIKENSAILQKAGVAVNDASVYLAHFLGPQGALKLLKASPETPVADLLGQDVIAANKSVLDGKTVEQVLAWSQQKMALDERQLAISTQMGAQGEKYLRDYQERVSAQKFELDLMVKSAREAAVAKAVRDEELKAKEAGVALTAEMRAETERLAAAEFDRKNVNEEVNKLIEKRSALFESLQIATLAGDQGKVESTIVQIREVEERLQSAIDKAIAFWQAMGGPGAEAAIANLRNIRDGIGQTLKKMEEKFLPTAQELNEQLADIGSNAFSAFAQAIANGENAAQAFFDTLLQGIADFLIEIGKAIVKQVLFNAISGAGGAGGIGGTIGGWITSIFHQGGVIGRSAAPARMVNPAIFANAARHHTGGLVGSGDSLRSGEVPIIAMRDEEVLTTDDPRHSFNGGGRTALNVKNVNVFDPTDVLEASLATVQGERVILNWLSRNSRKVNGALAG